MNVLELLDRDHPLTEDGIRQAAELNNRWRLASLHRDDDGDGVGCRGCGDGDAYDGVNGEDELALMDFSGLGELSDSDLVADDEMMVMEDTAYIRHDSAGDLAEGNPDRRSSFTTPIPSTASK